LANGEFFAMPKNKIKPVKHKILFTEFTEGDAQAVADKLGLDFDEMEFDIDQFRRGMNVELEHGKRDSKTNVTNDDPVMTGKIAWAHLNEIGNYYDLLEEMESNAEDDI